MTQPGLTAANDARWRWWWLGLALLLILAGWLYLRGYNASLPYIDHPDEPQFNLAAQTIVDTGSARAVSLDAYPPGIISLNYLLIKYLKPDPLHFSSVLAPLRLITIAVWLLLVAVIALLGRQLAGPITGLAAAAIWTVNPWVVDHVRFALADGYVTFFALLSLWLIILARKRNQPGQSTAADFSLMLAIVFKTQALVVTPCIALLPLIEWWSTRDRRRAILRHLGWKLLRFGIFLAWLFLLYPTLEAHRIPYWRATGADLALPSFDVLWANLAQVLLTFQPLGAWLLASIFALHLVARRDHVDRAALATLAVAGLAWLVGISLFGRQDSRQLYFVFAIASLFLALGWIGAWRLIDLLLTRAIPADRQRSWQRFAPAAIVFAGLSLSLLTSFRHSLWIAHRYTLPDRRNHLAEYMDRSLQPALYLSNADNHKTFNRSWGGYNGVHDFPRYHENALLQDKPIEQWRALGVVYAIMPQAPMLDDPDIYRPDETVLLKTYPVDPDFRGPDMVVLRLYPMQVPADARLGQIRLPGYDLNRTESTAGGALVFRHYWRADRPTETVHHVFNHLLDEKSEIRAQVDAAPLWDARRPTTSWDDPDEILLGREFTLPLPTDLPAGSYRLISGFYDPETGRRLHSADGIDHILIVEFTVNASDA